MPYHVSTLFNGQIIIAKSFLTYRKAAREAMRNARELADTNARLQEEYAIRLRTAAFDLDLNDGEVPAFAPLRIAHTFRVDRCEIPHLCNTCHEAGFQRAEGWPRRGKAWDLVDCESYIEIRRRPEALVFEDDEDATAFVLTALQSPGTPAEIRAACQLAVEEILFCNEHGIGAWREIYSLQKSAVTSCCECLDSGFLVMNREEWEIEGLLGEIQACDCGIFPSDEVAYVAARSAGYTVTEEGFVLTEPSRDRARRRVSR
ncbi:MAG TPA: hypothetical protein DD490_05035 [Acidobacteria bacterium]|nr:hypothetical protein [Acidobacteriota bacterium]